MNLDITRVRNLLQEFDFRTIFIEELGWDHCGNSHEVSIDGHDFKLNAVAEKRGMAVFLCSPLSNGNIPDYAVRIKIERQIAKSVHEHIIIYNDHSKTAQIWQWVKREAGKPAACREHAYHVRQPGDSLIQKIGNLAVTLDEEEAITIVDVTGKASTAFDVEKVTKKFYDRFKNEHDSFLKFIEGIPDDELHRWYASVMLNRLMFIYFIQKKGFLDGDDDYLRNKLLQSRKQGNDLFYRQFLCPLFFEGFAKKEKDRSVESNSLFGDIPYLNGGLFLKHQIEELHGRNIEISDKAFEKLFDFFDQYQWHLDERPLRKDNEINPDVLGYIFEKYINQKQMGAYYTKEDITEYISKNTVIPFLFDAAKQKCKIAFESESSVWRILQTDPDRYIYPAVRKGAELRLPTEIEAGIIGNPPYVDFKDLKEYVIKGYKTSKTRNLYSLILERCQSLVSDRSRQGYIVPVSSVATEGYLELQETLIHREIAFCSFDDRPAHLFDGLDKNTLSILLIGHKASQFNGYSTRLNRWNAEERANLFPLLNYNHTPTPMLKGCWPKIGSSIEESIWNKLFQRDKQLSTFYVEVPSFVTYYSRKVNAFLQILNFVPEVRDGKGNLRSPSEFKTLLFSSKKEAEAVFCCFNSTLFRWFMDVVSDGSHVNRREVDSFRFDPQNVVTDFPNISNLAARLSNDLNGNSESRTMRYKHDTLTVQCIIPKKSKPIIDEIDRVLAKHYGFTDEELDFIINYDIKYRMGRESEGD